MGPCGHWAAWLFWGRLIFHASRHKATAAAAATSKQETEPNMPGVIPQNKSVVPVAVAADKKVLLLQL